MASNRGVTKHTADEKRAYPHLNGRRKDSRTDPAKAARNAKNSGNNTDSSCELVSDFDDSSYLDRPALVDPPIAQSSPGNPNMKAKDALFNEIEIVKRIDDLVKVELSLSGNKYDEEMEESARDINVINAQNVNIVESLGDDAWIYE